jgi:hypothetical protein
MIARPRPFLEEALGYRLNGPPAFRSVTADELRAIPDPELEMQFLWQFPGLSEAARKQASEAARDAFRAVSVALYRSGTEEIMLPANSLRLAQWAEYQTPPGGQAVAFRSDFVALALAHEAARMALDQRCQLAKRWAACRSREEFEVLQALFEGQALWLTRRVARRLNMESVFPLLTDRLDCVLGRPADAIFDARAEHASISEKEMYTLCWMTLRERHRISLIGLGFFDYLEKQGLADAADRALTQPPPKLAWVEHPEMFCKAELRNAGGLVDFLERFGHTLAGNSGEYRIELWTADKVRQVASALGEAERAERVLHSWQHGAALISTPSASTEVAIGVVRLTDAAAARAYFGLSADLQRRQDELLNTRPNSPQRVSKSRSQATTLAGADEAARTDKEFQPATGDGLASQVTTLLVRSSDLVVLFTWRDLPADPDWASRFLADLLADTAGGR